MEDLLAGPRADLVHGVPETLRAELDGGEREKPFQARPLVPMGERPFRVWFDGPIEGGEQDVLAHRRRAGAAHHRVDGLGHLKLPGKLSEHRGRAVMKGADDGGGLGAGQLRWDAEIGLKGGPGPAAVPGVDVRQQHA